MTKRNKPATKIDMVALEKDILDRPDDYQIERAKRFIVSQKGICYALKRLGVSHKKNIQPSQSRRSGKSPFKKIKEYKKEGKPIIYVDKSGFAKDMQRLYGWSKKGHRCYGVQDWMAKGRINVIGALCNNSLLDITLFEGNINSDIFHTWLTQALLPCTPNRSVIVMDNAGHKLEFLPTYSPDLNPIEHYWAKAKARRRKLQCEVDTLFSENFL